MAQPLQSLLTDVYSVAAKITDNHIKAEIKGLFVVIGFAGGRSKW